MQILFKGIIVINHVKVPTMVSDIQHQELHQLPRQVNRQGLWNQDLAASRKAVREVEIQEDKQGII
jgi:hypothetical protein